MHDTEDKEWWCREGEIIEDWFLENIEPLLPYEIIKNPEKVENKYAPDFLLNSYYCDLKAQNTPFFKADDFYGIDPRFAVSFNHKDYHRYMQKYPNIGIFFFINWTTLEMDFGHRICRVEPLVGVWMIGIQAIHYMIDDLPSHSYQKRRNDTKGNAKSSYGLDLRNMKCVWRKI